MKYSMTIAGILTMFALPLLAQVGFSETCSNELVQFALMVPGALAAWYGRYRHGGVTALGFKK